MFSRLKRDTDPRARGHGRTDAPSSMPAGARSSLSVIAADTSISGDIGGNGEIRIEGEVRGSIVAARVSVVEGGYVSGSIFAEFLRIEGTVEGPVEAMCVTITRGAHVLGNVTHNTLTIEPGATVDGRRPWRPPNFLDGRRPWGEPLLADGRKP